MLRQLRRPCQSVLRIQFVPGRSISSSLVARGKEQFPAGMPRRLVFFGAPGVGKGTFAQRVAPRLRIPAISTGDMMRTEIEAGSELGEIVRESSESGQLVSDDVVNEIVRGSEVRKRLSAPDCANGYILDGYPRTVNQAEVLSTFAEVDKVLNFTLPEHVLLTKLLGRRACGICGRGFNVAFIDEGELYMPPLLPKKGECDKCDGDPPLTTRADDTEEVIRDRLRVYQEETHPLVEYYHGKGKLHDFPVKKGIDDLPRLFQEVFDLEYSE